MSAAADLLRQALADAPDGLHVAIAGDFLELRISSDAPAVHDPIEWNATMRLVGLLLAAAPYLVDLIEDFEYVGYELIESVMGVITEAAQAMEVES